MLCIEARTGCARASGWVWGCLGENRRGQILINTEIKIRLRRWGGWRDLGLRRCIYQGWRDLRLRRCIWDGWKDLGLRRCVRDGCKYLRTSYNPRGCCTLTTAPTCTCAWACCSRPTTAPSCTCAWACSSSPTTGRCTYGCYACTWGCNSCWFSLMPIVCLPICCKTTTKPSHII